MTTLRRALRRAVLHALIVTAAAALAFVFIARHAPTPLDVTPDHSTGRTNP